jgi:hypothetical protein
MRFIMDETLIIRIRKVTILLNHGNLICSNLSSKELFKTKFMYLPRYLLSEAWLFYSRFAKSTKRGNEAVLMILI